MKSVSFAFSCVLLASANYGCPGEVQSEVLMTPPPNAITQVASGNLGIQHGSVYGRLWGLETLSLGRLAVRSTRLVAFILLGKVFMSELP